MAQEVTDPDLIAKLDAAEKSSSGKEVTDPDLISKLDAAEKDGTRKQNTYEELTDPKAWGRAAALAGRAVLEAPAQIAALPADAVASAINMAKNPSRLLNPQEYNPLEHRPMEGDVPFAGEQVHNALTSAGLPEPKSWQEKLAYGVESALTGAKVPVAPKGVSPAVEAAQTGKSPSTLATVRQGLAAPTEERLRARGANKAQQKAAKNAKKAEDAVNKALARDKNNITDASKEVKNAQARGVPLTLADTGRNATTTAEVIAQRPGAGQTIMEENRLASLKDEKQRVPGQVRSAIGTEDDYGLFTKGLENTRSVKAKANYEAVRQDATPVTDEKIAKILEDPRVKDLYEEARAAHMEERRLRELAGDKSSPQLVDIYGVKTTKSPILDKSGKPFQNMEAEKIGTVPDVKSLDYLIRHIDESIDRLYKSGTTGGIASSLKTVRNALKSRLEEISPAYQKASKTYGLDSQIIEARELGNKGFMDMTPGAARQAFSSMNDSQKNALRMGVTENLLKAAEKSGKNRNIANEVLGGDRQQKVLRSMFDNDRDFDIFKKTLELEDRIHQNTMKISGGSPTFRRAAAADDFEETPASEKIGKAATVINLVKKGWIGTGLKMVLHMIQNPSWNQGKAEMAARILTAKDPELVIRRLQALEKMDKAPNVSRKVAATKGAATLKGDYSQDTDQKYSLKDGSR